MQLGWKTGAIIPELKVQSLNVLCLSLPIPTSLSLPSLSQSELEKSFSPEAKRHLAEILALENMLKNYQVPTCTCSVCCLEIF